MGTIQTHVSRIYKKLHVNSRTEAVMKYLDATGGNPHAFSRG
jgi:DNA-binding NarL/FixJ family response regulator